MSLRRSLYLAKPRHWGQLVKHLWYGWRFTTLKSPALLTGWPDISNDGELHVGKGFALLGHIHRCSLGIFKGAVIRIGDNVVINNGTILSSRIGIEIGEGVAIGYHCLILDSDGHALAPGLPVSEGPIKIGRHVWLASNVTVLQGVTIGDFAVVATGSVVTKDVPPYAVVAGTPAKVLRYVDNDIQWRFHPNDAPEA
jgi:acetyltransferase-like isoleucine patch superfamily enzyme